MKINNRLNNHKIRKIPLLNILNFFVIYRSNLYFVFNIVQIIAVLFYILSEYNNNFFLHIFIFVTFVY